MARDDYYVVVYQILAYLYTQLKAGDPVDQNLLKHDSKYLQINEKYWLYIMEHLVLEGYIEHITIKKTWGNQVVVSGLENCRITPAGIAFLCDNTFIEKAKHFLKDIKAIVPFI